MKHRIITWQPHRVYFLAVGIGAGTSNIATSNVDFGGQIDLNVPI